MRISNFLSSLLAGLFLATAALPPASAATVPAAGQVAKLTAILESQSSQKEKVDACRELAGIGNAAAVAPLAALLPDEQLSHMARYALEVIPDPSAAAALRAALNTLHGPTLVGVIGSVGVRRDALAVGQLIPLLQSPDADTAQAAARALGSIATPEAVTALQRALPTVPAGNQPAFCEGLLRSAEAMTAAGRLKEAQSIYDSLRVVPIVAVQAAALRGAILTRQGDGISLLVKSLHEPEATLCAAALKTAREMPGADVTFALAKELPELPVDLQVLLIRHLGQRGDSAAVPALIATAKNGAPSVQLASLQALGMIGDDAAIPVFVESLAAEDVELDRAAKETLATMPGQATDQAVLVLMQSPDTTRSRAGMELAAARRLTNAFPALLKLAKSGDAELRREAIKRCGELAGPADLPAIADLLLSAPNAEDMKVAQHALATVCRKLKPDECTVRLRALFALASPAPRCALIRIMASLSDSAVLDLLYSAANDPDAEVRSTALSALCNWSNADAAPQLLRLAKASADPGEKALYLHSYLLFAHDEEVPAKDRLTMCRESAALVQTDDEKKLLLAALVTLNSIEAVALVNAHLDNQATREEACAATLAIAAKILQGKTVASATAAQLVAPLEKVVNLTAKPETATRAKALLTQAGTYINTQR